MKETHVVLMAVFLLGAIVPLWAEDSDKSQDQAASQTGAAPTTNGFDTRKGGNEFSSPLKSQFNNGSSNPNSPANPGVNAMPKDQINTGHQMIQEQIQATNNSAAVNPGVKTGVGPGPIQKNAVGPGPVQKVGLNPGLSGKTSKLKTAKNGLLGAKGFQKTTGLKNASSPAQKGLSGTGTNTNLPAVQK